MDFIMAGVVRQLALLCFSDLPRSCCVGSLRQHKHEKSSRPNNSRLPWFQHVRCELKGTREEISHYYAVRVTKGN